MKSVKLLSRTAILIALATTLAPAGGCGGRPASIVNAPASAPEAAEGKGKADVILKSHNDQKISVIKAVREITGLGLADAKDLVESAPAAIKRGVSREDAEQIRQKLEQAGATVEIRW